MRIETIKGHDELLSLKDDWNRLTTDDRHTVFSKYPFIKNWHEQYRSFVELEIMLGIKDNKIIGIAPLVNDQGVMRFAGNNDCKEPIWDYADFIVGKDDSEEFYDSVFKKIGNRHFHLEEIKQDSGLMDYFSSKRNVSINSGSNISSITLPSSFDEYFGSLEKGFQKDILYYDRKIAAAGLTLEMITAPILGNARQLDEHLERFFDLHQKVWMSKGESGFFTNTTEGERVKNLYRDLASDLLVSGNYFLSTFKKGDECVAMWQGFKDEKTAYAYATIINPDYKNLSPGKILLMKTLQHFIGTQHTTFDLLRGNDAYKAKLCSVMGNNYVIADGRT